jgi:hypothetical protein
MMKLPRFAGNSLKTRLALVTLVTFLLSIWSIAYYINQILREEMINLLGDQQVSAVSLVANEVNKELSDRLTALTKVGAPLRPLPWPVRQRFRPTLSVALSSRACLTRASALPTSRDASSPAFHFSRLISRPIMPTVITS